MKKLLFYVTVDSYFVSHRLPLASAAKAAGYEVVVVTQVKDKRRQIAAAGLRIIDLDASRRSVNPLSELFVILRLARIYARERPDIVHHVALKPVLYGSIAARLARVPSVVNAIMGMGYLFTSASGLMRWLMRVVRLALRVLLRKTQVVVQNPDDAELVRSLGATDVAVIRGSGVDPEQYVPLDVPLSPPTVMLASRLLWDKGVGEYVEAARLLCRRGVEARLVLVGAPDPDNYGSVSDEDVKGWEGEGVVECWGYQADMPSVLIKTSIACLPSYGEGVPKSLIEAASCGLPIVTTDVPGCREIVADGDNGLLVPPKDSAALADALEKLIVDSELRCRMGKRGRARVLAEFSQDRVIDETLSLYRRLSS